MLWLFLILVAGAEARWLTDSVLLRFEEQKDVLSVRKVHITENGDTIQSVFPRRISLTIQNNELKLKKAHYRTKIPIHYGCDTQPHYIQQQKIVWYQNVHLGISLLVQVRFKNGEWQRTYEGELPSTDYNRLILVAAFDEANTHYLYKLKYQNISSPALTITNVLENQRLKRQLKPIVSYNFDRAYYHIGLLIVIDSNFFSVFKSENEMTYYLLNIASSVDVKYKRLSEDGGIKIRVFLKGLHVSRSPEYDIWGKAEKAANGKERCKLESKMALQTLGKWAAKFSKGHRGLPRFDHASLITRCDIYGDHSSYDQIGVSYTGGICGATMGKAEYKSHGVSIIEANGALTSGSTLAHEIGHNLGSRHDGPPTNACDYTDEFIMSPIVGSPPKKRRMNPFTFSTCSIASFKKNILKNGWACLLDMKGDQQIQVGRWKNIMSVPAGQRFPLNAQCEQIHGPGYRYCWEVIGNSPSNARPLDRLCRRLDCTKSPGLINCRKGDGVSMPGTSCGNKKWCDHQAKCVEDPGAPEMDESCFNGDDPTWTISIEDPDSHFPIDIPCSQARDFKWAAADPCSMPKAREKCCSTCDTRPVSQTEREMIYPCIDDDQFQIHVPINNVSASLVGCDAVQAYPGLCRSVNAFKWYCCRSCIGTEPSPTAEPAPGLCWDNPLTRVRVRNPKKHRQKSFIISCSAVKHWVFRKERLCDRIKGFRRACCQTCTQYEPIIQLIK